MQDDQTLISLLLIEIKRVYDLLFAIQMSLLETCTWLLLELKIL